MTRFTLARSFTSRKSNAPRSRVSTMLSSWYKMASYLYCQSCTLGVVMMFSTQLLAFNRIIFMLNLTTSSVSASSDGTRLGLVAMSRKMLGSTLSMDDKFRFLIWTASRC